MSDTETRPRHGTEHPGRAGQTGPTPGLVCIFSEPGVDPPSSLTLGTEALTIGRQPDCDVFIDSADVSRRHAILRARADAWSVQDDGSRNGTWVDGRRTRGEAQLDPGSILRLGPVVYLAVDSVERFAAAGALRTDEPIAGGPAMRELREFAERFAESNLPVLLTGETGVGKEVVARALHARSGRTGALIAVNCNELVAGLVESTLFGHRRGAFTGANHDHPGHFGAAAGGTLLLDEVGDLPATLQGKLLRALERGEIQPLGAPRPIPVDVRVISATHRNLRAMVERGEFREDLFHRLSGLSAWIPPLRDRVEDVPLLARFFLDQDLAESASTLTSEVVEALCLYPWPGNVRELRSTILAAATTARADRAERISSSRHLRDEVHQHLAARAAGRGPADPIRARRVEEAMTRHKGNVSHAARELGLHRAQVYKALDRAGRKASEFRTSGSGDEK